MIYILMGVSGSGKTTIGQLLAQKLGWPFYDGDDFHPPENIEKMRRGIPLTDADRLPWLSALRDLLQSQTSHNRIVACSGLKQRYREYLSAYIPDICWIYLKGDYYLLKRRLQGREGHFMSADLLRSQFEAMEEPDNAWVIEIDRTPEAIVATLKSLVQSNRFSSFSTVPNE
jgi:gluconokinase